MPLSLTEELNEYSSTRAVQWVEQVCEFLELQAPSAMQVTLHPNVPMPYTKGHHVVLPFDTRRAPDLDAMSYGLVALPHELVHAIAGRSPSHLLNEGLAVHADSVLGLAGPSWPSYHLRPHRWVQAFYDDRTSIGLRELLDWLPHPLVTGVQRAACGVAYLHAASFVAFLLQEQGWQSFWRVFRAGGQGLEDRDLAQVEAAWSDSLGGPLTAEEARALVRSQNRWQ